MATLQSDENMGNNMAEESIYMLINRNFMENPVLPYAFQDPYLAGRRDVSYVIWKDNLPFLIKEKMAIELMGHIVTCIKGQSSINEIRKVLDEKPIYMYLNKLCSRIKLYLSEKLIDENQLYSFGIKLATQSAHEEEVKLGMIILGFFENDIVKQILKTLGLHSSFTLYALEASRNFMCQNQFVYELAQNTCGYGKLIALHLLEPIVPNQKKWMFEQGAINEVMPNISAIICLEKVDMATFYQDLTINRDTFPKLSYLLAYALENSDIKDFSQVMILLEKYIKAVKAYTVSFIDLAAIVVIEKSMSPNREQYGIDINKNGCSGNKEREIRNICNEIIKQPRWKYTVLKELRKPHEHTSLIVLVLEKLKIQPHFVEFTNLLCRDLFDMDLLKYFLIEHPQIYLEDVFQYLNCVLPEDVMDENPQEIPEENITYEHKPDIWLVYLLKAMRIGKKYEEAFFIRCLTVRFPDARIEAIQALRMFRTVWSKDVLPALEHAYEIEPVKNIKKRLLRLMGKTDEKEKEQRYVDISESKITPSPFDVCILKTKIAGTFFHDLMVVEGRIEAGDILYLVREPDNKYDEKAIIVAAEDGYVLGYVPKVDNAIPSSLMDAGEKLYAILLSDDIKIGKPDIQIMLSKRPEREGKVIKFPY